MCQTIKPIEWSWRPEQDRAKRSIIDHLHIIEALEARDTELAERLSREHTMNLAAHIEAHVDYLD